MGFIGLHTAKALLDAGEDVVLTRFRRTRMPGFLSPHVDKRLFVETVDVLNGEALIEAGRKHSVSGIIHLASPPMHGPLAEGLRQNVQGLLNVLEAGSTLGVKRVLLPSSIAIYAGVDAALWREDAPLPIASPYPMTAYKKVFEKDTAEALAGLQLAPVLNHSIYNIGGGKSLSNREVADAVQKAVPDAKIELQPGRSSQPQYPALDISRLKEDIGWTPRYTIDSGIAEYVAWLKAGNPQ